MKTSRLLNIKCSVSGLYSVMKKMLIHILLLILIMHYSLSCMNRGTIAYSTQSTIEKIKNIANQYAVGKGYDLSTYNSPEIKYDPKKKEWNVSYIKKCKGILFFKKCPVGGEFDIVIDDLKGNIVFFFQGA
ncbi:MAG: hypothetical protein GY870_18815 [archaeon]|nr:hypothetical protein [archaeon]